MSLKVKSNAKRIAQEIELGESALPQKTLAGPVEFSGEVLHLGGFSRVQVVPADEDQGITFSLVQSGETASLAKADYCQHTTSIEVGSQRVLTIEHLLSAIYGLGINNAHVRIEGQPEVPILDGSALCFAQGLLQRGIIAQRTPAKSLRIRETIWFHETSSESIIIARPSHSFIVDADITFEESLIGTQRIRTEIVAENYLANIAPARTFLKESIDKTPLKSVRTGRLKGLDYSDCNLSPVILYSNRRFLTPLRFDDEMVRHKVLDFVGDIATLGIPIMGEFFLYRPGHRTNLSFCKFLLDRTRALLGEEQ